MAEEITLCGTTINWKIQNGIKMESQCDLQMEVKLVFHFYPERKKGYHTIGILAMLLHMETRWSINQHFGLKLPMISFHCLNTTMQYLSHKQELSQRSNEVNSR